MWRGFCNQRPVGGAKRGNSSRRCFYKAVARLASVSPARSRKGGKKRVGDGTRSQTARKSPRGHRIPTLLNWSTRPKGLTIETHAPRPSSPSKQSIRLCLQTRNLSDTSSVFIDSSEKDKRSKFPPFFPQDRANIKSFGWDWYRAYVLCCDDFALLFPQTYPFYRLERRKFDKRWKRSSFRGSNKPTRYSAKSNVAIKTLYVSGWLFFRKFSSAGSERV